MLRFLSVSIEGSWIAPCTPIVTVTMGFTFQPFVLRIERVGYIFIDFLPSCNHGESMIALIMLNQ